MPDLQAWRPGMVVFYNLHCMLSMTFDLGTASKTMIACYSGAPNGRDALRLFSGSLVSRLS